MKKAIIALILIVSLVTSYVTASGISFEAVNAANMKNVIPHTVSKDGSMLVEEKLTATDYATVLMALTNIQNNNAEIESHISKNFLRYIVSTESLFIKPQGAVVSTYDYKEKKFVPNNKFDIVSIASFTMAFDNMLKDIEKFNYNKQLKLKVKKYAQKNIENTSKYIMQNMYSDGKFFEDASKAKVNIKSMANGLLSLKSLWNLKKNTMERDKLVKIARETATYIKSSWSKEFEVFGFNENPANIKFDLRDFGMFLWSIKELSEILADNGYGYEALDLMTYTHKMLDRAMVENVTYKEAGIVREIQIVNGEATSVKDEINTGRLNNFLYGLTKWNESPFAKLIGIQDKYFNFVKNLVMYSVKNHIDEYAIIHDTKFSDISIKNDVKETPYLNWFIITGDYMLENHSSYFNSSEVKDVTTALEKNYKFLTENIMMNGTKLIQMMEN